MATAGARNQDCSGQRSLSVRYPRWDAAFPLQEALLASHLYLVAAFGAVLLPSIWSLLFGLLALRLDESAGCAEWPVYLARMRALNLLAVPAWWAICGALAESGVSRGPMSNWPALAVLILPLSIGIAATRFLTSWIGRRFDDHHWMAGDFLSFSFWNTLSTTVPLLLFAAGIDAVDDWRLTGILWIACAGLLTRFAMARLRISGGFKPRLVKSGDLFKRSFAMAKQMGLPLKGIFVVPAGRGRLLNAYGAPGFIGMTDISVHRLQGPQLDFAIGHELAHIRLKHGRNKLRIVAGMYCAIASLTLIVPHVPLVWHVFLQFVAILTPVLLSYFVSRRIEFAADRAAVEFTGEGEAAIRALAILYSSSGVPDRFNRFDELLLTHPSLWKRIDAIARAAELPSECVARIRQQFDDEREPLAERS